MVAVPKPDGRCFQPVDTLSESEWGELIVLFGEMSTAFADAAKRAYEVWAARSGGEAIAP